MQFIQEWRKSFFINYKIRYCLFIYKRSSFYNLKAQVILEKKNLLKKLPETLFLYRLVVLLDSTPFFLFFFSIVYACKTKY
jgi:hypothetical protein